MNKTEKTDFYTQFKAKMKEVKVYLNLDFICAFSCSQPKETISSAFSHWLNLCLCFKKNHLELIMIDPQSFNMVSLSGNDFTRFLEGYSSSINKSSSAIDKIKVREFIRNNYNPHMLLLLETDNETMSSLK